MTDLPSGASGERHRLRILAETLRLLDEVLAESASFDTRFAPDHWSGLAHDRFVPALRDLGGQWSRLVSTSTDVTSRVAGFSTFLYELPRLIEDFPHLAGARAETAAALIAALDAASDELDRLGHDPEPGAVTAAPVSDQVRSQAAPTVEVVWPDEDPDDRPPAPAPPTPPHPPDLPDAPAAAPPPDDPLCAAMLAGPRTPSIPWHG